MCWSPHNVENAIIVDFYIELLNNRPKGAIQLLTSNCENAG